MSTLCPVVNMPLLSRLARGVHFLLLGVHSPDYNYPHFWECTFSRALQIGRRAQRSQGHRYSGSQTTIGQIFPNNIPNKVVPKA